MKLKEKAVEYSSTTPLSGFSQADQRTNDYTTGYKAAIADAAETAEREANSFESDKSGDYRDGWYLAARGVMRAIRALGEE